MVWVDAFGSVGTIKKHRTDRTDPTDQTDRHGIVLQKAYLNRLILEVIGGGCSSNYRPAAIGPIGLIGPIGQMIFYSTDQTKCVYPVPSESPDTLPRSVYRWSEERP